MSALPLRPALADVLRALTSDLHETMESALAGDRISLGPKPYFECRTDEVALLAELGPADRRSTGCKTGIYSSRPWITRDPAEAFETLIARGVLPDAWAGDVRRAFVCSCDGKAVDSDDCPAHNGGCDGIGIVAHPPTIPALVAWASLGPAAILRAEELARETVARLRPWGAPQVERVVWCVRTLSNMEHDGVGCAWDDDAHDGAHALESGGQSPAGDFVEQAHDVWEMGLVIASITTDAVTIVVPPVGAP